jgi:hypothetical protein
MKLMPAGFSSELDRYLGYWEPDATTGLAFDRDHSMQDEVRNAARSLAATVVQHRTVASPEQGADLPDPRQK